MWTSSQECLADRVREVVVRDEGLSFVYVAVRTDVLASARTGRAAELRAVHKYIRGVDETGTRSKSASIQLMVG